MLLDYFRKFAVVSNFGMSFKDINGNNKTGSGDYYSIAMGLRNDYGYIAIGSDDTEPEMSDYAVKAPISITKNSQRVSMADALSGGDMFQVTTTYTNNTESPVVVKEVAIYAANNYISFTACVARSVLETPVTIGVGESYAFTYKVSV